MTDEQKAERKTLIENNKAMLPLQRYAGNL
jgi:hypothetical protein